MLRDNAAEARLALLGTSIKRLAVAIAAVTVARVGVEYLDLSGFHKHVTFLVIKLIAVTYAAASIYRLKDRVLRLVFTAAGSLLILQQLTFLSGYSNRFLSTALVAADAVLVALVTGTVYRLGTLYAKGKEEREAEFLYDLAIGTSARIGVDFLSDLSRSIAHTLHVSCVCITESSGDPTSEKIVALAAAEGTILPALALGKKIDCTGETTYSDANCTSIPLTDSSEDPLGHICLVHEIHFSMTSRQRSTLLVFAARAAAELERKKLDDANLALTSRMLQVQKLESLGVMAGGIAHDFNNLLSSIRSNAEVIGEAMSDRSAEKKNLDGIESAVQRGAALCNRLLAYAGCTVRKNETCNLNSLIRQLETVVRATSPGQLFDLQLADENTNVRGDETQLNQVLFNLLCNAAEASGVNQSITIRTWSGSADQLPGGKTLSSYSDRKYVFLDVIDQGPGVAPEDTTRIFDPFFTTKEQGRGLGLAAVLGIVKTHGGEIYVHSDSGIGTTFTVALPAAGEQESNEPLPDVEERPANDTISVLLVDDDAMVRKATQSLLEVSGVNVVAAKDGYEAIEVFKYEGNVFQAIVLDQTMPGMSGIETYRQLRELGATCKGILISGYSEKSIVGCPQDLIFLAKPFMTSELLAAIDAPSPTHGKKQHERAIETEAAS